MIVTSNGGLAVGSNAIPPANGFYVSGDVRIGRTNPAYKLDILGTLRSSQGASLATSSGGVAIGLNTPGRYKLHVQTVSEGQYAAAGLEKLFLESIKE